MVNIPKVCTALEKFEVKEGKRAKEPIVCEKDLYKEEIHMPAEEQPTRPPEYIIQHAAGKS